MRRVLLTVVGLVLFGLLATPTQAMPEQATVSGSDTESGRFVFKANKVRTVTSTNKRLARKSCVNKSQIHSGRVRDSGSAEDNRVYVSALVAIVHCTNYDEFRWVRYAWRNPGEPEGFGIGECGPLQFVNLNMGKYGSWNPPARQVDCSVFSSNDEDIIQKTVYPPSDGAPLSHGASDRCSSLWIKMGLDWADDRTTAMDTQCLP